VSQTVGQLNVARSQKESIMQKQVKLSTKDLDKFHEIELEKLYESITSIKNLRLQMASFFGTANLTAMSLAFTSQKAGLIFFAVVLIWAFAILDSRSRMSVITCYFRILQMSLKYSTDDSFYLNVHPGSELNYVRTLLNSNNQEKQIKGLTKIPLRNQSISAFWLPLLASIIEIAIGLAFWRIFGWKIY
jgi:hypothetical protein